MKYWEMNRKEQREELAKVFAATTTEKIKTILNTLTESETDALTKIFGIETDVMTMTAIAKERGRSRARIGQIVYKGVRKMLHPSRLRKLKGDNKTEWTKERPTEPGAYWRKVLNPICASDTPPKVVNLRAYNKTLCILNSEPDWAMSLWAGPIKEPAN